MYSLLSYSCLLLTFLGAVACNNDTSPAPVPLKLSKMTSTLGYDFQKPNQTFKLSKKLKETSGLTFVPDSGLVTIQDEHGTLYWLNPKGAINKQLKFAADGDYEGLTFKEPSFFVLRSDGVLFQIDNWKKEKAVTKIIKTQLGAINDAEGLVYHSSKQQLWIACKESATINGKESSERAVYAYDFASNTLLAKPVFTISRAMLKTFVQNNMPEHADYDYYKKLLRKEKKAMPLQPSAIAIHPLTQDIYLLCAVGNSLIVLNPKYQIKALVHLPSKDFEQPEGLTFGTKGELFIASEGQKKKARIYQFNYHL